MNGDDLSSAGLGNRLFPHICARSFAYRFNKTFIKLRSNYSKPLDTFSFDPNCKDPFDDELDGKVSFRDFEIDLFAFDNQPLLAESSYKLSGYSQTYLCTDFPRVREYIYRGIKTGIQSFPRNLFDK
jgi:hypothetical protein